jgi:ferrous iron transport protein B
MPVALKVILNFADHGPRGEAVALVGSPNVGKSVIFGALTGRYATVSNYPGTTVEVTRGRARVAGAAVEIVDTPGLYSLLPLSDDERVTRGLLFADAPRLVVHVVDAKNLERSLPLTLQLVELGFPVALILNLADEAERHGVVIDVAGLSRELGLPVAAAVATRRGGLDAALAAIARGLEGDPETPPRVDYGELEPRVEVLARALPARVARAARGLALLLLQGDDELAAALGVPAEGGEAALPITARRHERAREIARRHVVAPARRRRTFADRLSELAMRPLTGVPILLAVLYFGLYQLVGVVGAGELVDLLETRLFGELVNPRVDAALLALFPESPWARELVGGEYGVVTLGVTYAIAIILPIVSLFFLFFSALEDSGYFPRLAMLVDRLFKRIGLNGRAVIPLVLGFGCGTMATMVTRIQETRRERIITTLLLAVAIPCSAQYGVVTGLLASRPAAFAAWAAILGGAFVLVGRVASRAVAGEAPSFYMELPPLRWPRPANVAAKTFARMRWYFLEVLPLFVLASVVVWAGRMTGLFDLALAGLRPLVMAIGLPAEAAQAFLFGFFRRDFGAAGLYDLQRDGLLDGGQLLVACVTLTLFLPCVAQLLIMRRERGARQAAAVAAGVFAGAFVVGGAVNLVVKLLGGIA